MKLNLHTQYIDELPFYDKAKAFRNGRKDEIIPYLYKTALEKKEFFMVRNSDKSITTVPNEHGKDQYSRRVLNLEYFNHTAQIVELHLSTISNQSISFDGIKSNIWNTITDDVTGYGDSYKSFIRACVEDYLTYGKVGVLIDSEKEITEYSRPYLIKYIPQNILDWSMFNTGKNKGKLNSLILNEGLIGGKKVIKELITDGESNFTYNIYVEENEEYKLVESGQGSTVFIPFVIIGKGYHESCVKDVIPISEVRLNQKSALQNILHYQSFSKSILFSEHAQKDVLSFAEGTITYSTDPNGRFETIQPTEPLALEREIQRLDKACIRIGMKERIQIIDDSRQIQSAESKSLDASNLLEFYESVIDLFESKFNFINLFLSDLSGVSDSVNITISRNFYLSDSANELNLSQIVFTQARSLGLDDVAKEILKTSIAKVITDEDVLTKLNKTIDNNISLPIIRFNTNEE